MTFLTFKKMENLRICESGTPLLKKLKPVIMKIIYNIEVTVVGYHFLMTYTLLEG